MMTSIVCVLGLRRITMEWTTINLFIHPEAVDIVSAFLFDLGVLGVEILDYQLTDEERTQLFVDYMDEQPEIKEETEIRFYISKEDQLDVKIEQLKEELSRMSVLMAVGSCHMTFGTTKEEDWANNWKQYYKPFKVGKNIWVKPIWEPLMALAPRDQVIEIDPGMAFGSGTHETTFMCIELIEKYLTEVDGLKRVVDVGCGSGILGLAAAKLGADKVTCIDLDPNAVKVAKENVAHNQLSEVITVSQGDLIVEVKEPCDVLVANIMAEVVIFLTGDVSKVLKPQGIYITSGIILKKIDAVQEALLKNNFDVIEIQRKGEWAAIVARLKG